jgi:hypothetical protein
MKAKFRILVFVSLLIMLVLENAAVAAEPEIPKDPREGISSAELAESGEIVVAPLLGEYSWDQSLLSDDQIQLPGPRYYNRYMDFEINGKTYAAGCGPVAVGQVMQRTCRSSFLTLDGFLAW